MGILGFLFLMIALVLIFFVFYFSGKKDGISHKAYWIRQWTLSILAILSLLIMIVMSNRNNAYNNSELSQISASSKNNIVDSKGNITYVYRTGEHAKLTFSSYNSSAKISRVNKTDFKIKVHLDSDNYDDISIKSHTKNGTHKVKKTIYNKEGMKESKSEDSSISSSVSKEFDNVSDDDSSEYTDDMASDIKDSVNNNESIQANKVSVNGQFDSDPKTMSISIQSDRFTGKHDEDYLSILDAIHESQKHDLSKFSNIKYVLVGKLTDGYHDSYEPIAWFNFTGKSLKGLKTNELTLDMLEGIATDYHFKPLKE